MAYQKFGTKKPDKSDHIWTRVKNDGCKCVLCGAATSVPPDYPTPKDWMPKSFEPLTEEERDLARKE